MSAPDSNFSSRGGSPLDGWQRELLLELQADRAMGELDDADAIELERLHAAHPELDDERMDLAAAAVELALVGAHGGLRLEPMPQALRARVMTASANWLSGERPRSSGDASSMPVVGSVPLARIGGEEQPSRSGGGPVAAGPSRGPAAALGWIAAAAAVVLAATAWWPSPPAAVVEPRATAAALRSRLLETDGGAMKVAWSATEDPMAAGAAGADSGDVVWSDAEQSGVMRIRGLAANDASECQYQLWIFDATRDERYPVDGGVFDVPAGAQEVLVPIDAKLPVREPVLFAVTVEPPGGVVVSERRIVLVAKAPS